jgi:hypothetical protein
VGSADGTASFYSPPSGFVSHSLLRNGARGNGASIQVLVRTLASSMRALGHTHVDVLKLDVEGEEVALVPALLAQFGAWPRRHGPDVIAIDMDSLRQSHHAYNAPGGAAVMAALSGAGYDLFSHRGADVVYVRRAAFAPPRAAG